MRAAFASRGASVLTSPRLLPVEASVRVLRALRMVLFRRSSLRLSLFLQSLSRQSCSDDSSQQIPYHGSGALSPSSRRAVSYQPVATCKCRCLGGETGDCALDAL